MEKQLADLQSQLAEQQEKSSDTDKADEDGAGRDRFGTPKESAMQKDEAGSDDSPSALLALGVSLDRAQESNALAARAQADADRMNRELDYAANHPIEALRLTDATSIQHKQGEIAAVKSTAAKAQEAQSSALQNASDALAESHEPTPAEDVPASGTQQKSGQESEPSPHAAGDRQEQARNAYTKKTADLPNIHIQI